MTRRAFDQIAEGLDEALAIARGKTEAFKLHVPVSIDVRRIRSAVDMTQEQFAAAFGFSLQQIRDWEQGRSRPLGGVRAYLLVIEKSPTVVLDLLRSASDDRAAA